MDRPRHMHTHTHDFTLFDERIAPGLSAVTPRWSHSPGASAVARRESKAPSRPPFPLALYTQSVPVCLHSINLFTLSCRRRGGGDLGRFCGVWVD